MPIETLNLELFSLINASAEAKPWIIHLAIFIANDLLYLVLGLLVLWCFGDLANKERALRAVLLTSIALGVGYLISLYYPHSRPFVLGVGHTLIEHSATASFPSNHMLIFSTIALSYLSVGRRVAGGILLLMAFAVAWSRIYIGVHFRWICLAPLVWRWQLMALAYIYGRCVKRTLCTWQLLCIHGYFIRYCVVAG